MSDRDVRLCGSFDGSSDEFWKLQPSGDGVLWAELRPKCSIRRMQRFGLLPSELNLVVLFIQMLQVFRHFPMNDSEPGILSECTVGFRASS